MPTDGGGRGLEPVRRRRRRRPLGHPESAYGVTRPRNGGQPSPRKLDERQRAWLDDGIVDEDWVRATRRHYPEHRAPSMLARQLLATPKLASAIETMRRHVLRHAHIEKAWVLTRAIDVVNADPNEVVQHRRVPCRYCHGDGHRYQFRDVEMEWLLGVYACGVNKEPYHLLDPEMDPGGFGAAYYDLGTAGRPFDPLGGDGYTTHREIFSVANGMARDCPVCDGDGISKVYINDTRYLSAEGKLLFEGIEVTPSGGYKVTLRDKKPFYDMLFKASGWSVDRKVLMVRKLDPDVLTDDELRAAILEAQSLTVDLSSGEFEEVDGVEFSSERDDP